MNRYPVDWFSQLEEPYRSKAISNCEEQFKRAKFDSLWSALAGSFYWDESPEGNKYWEDICDKILKQENSPLKILR